MAPGRIVVISILFLTLVMALTGCNSNGPVEPGGGDGPPEWVKSAGVTSVVAGEYAITVYWGEAIDLQDPPVEYLVYMDTDYDPFDREPIIRDNNTPYTFTGLGIGEEYWFGVRCQDSAEPPQRDNNVKVVGARTNDHGWAQVWGGVGFDRCSDVATDGVGNVYTTGWYEQTVDFDPSPEEDIHTTDGEDVYGIFLTKHNPRGEFQWARTWGGKGSNLILDWGKALAIDPDDNIIVTGRFEGDIDFDPGPGEDYHKSDYIYNDAFVSKFDPDGEYLWGRNWTIFNQDSGEDVAVDNTGNIYVLGESVKMYFNEFGMGNYYYTFLRKLDSSGNLLWQLLFGQDGSNMNPGSVAVDNTGDVCLTGHFYDVNQIDLDPGPGVDIHVTATDNDCSLIKLDGSGAYKWGITWGSTLFWSIKPFCLTTDNDRNIYVAGPFSNTVDFDPGESTDIRVADGTCNAFLSKFSPDGIFQWVETWKIQGFDKVQGIVLNGEGDIYMICETLGFPGLDRFSLRMLDGGGNFQWEQTWPQTEVDMGMLVGYDLALDNQGNILIAGTMNGVMDFNPGEDVDILESNGDCDAFVMRLLPDETGLSFD